MRVIVAIDASTTASKAVAFDVEGRVVASARSPIETANPRPGWFEQDADAWWSSTADALRALTAQLDASGHEPVALGITHQRESFVCLGADGVPLRPAILWLDTRADREIAELGTNAVHALSGKPPSTTPALYKLAWLARNEPETLERAASVLDVHGFLSWKLTDERATSVASADPLGLVAMSAMEWSDQLVELAGLRAEQLARLVPPGGLVGTVTAHAQERTGLPQGLPVIAGAGDGQAGGLGVAVTASDRLYLSLGTSLTMGIHTEAYAFSKGFRTLGSPLGHGYTLEGLIAGGALSVNWFRERIARLPGEPALDSALADGAASVPAGCRGLMFLPYLPGVATPYWDGAARGAFVGLDDQHTRDDLYRAVLEGLAFESRLLIDRLEAASSTTITRVTAMGGGSQSELWLQIMADVLGRDVSVAESTEAASLGAAILAAHAVDFGGRMALEQRAERMTRTGARFAPRDTESRLYARLFETYAALYPALAPHFAAVAAVTTPGA
jgi:xylulokinase